MDRYIVVLVGGGVGALVRYVLASEIMKRYGGTFPLGTFVINITGSFLIGVLMTIFTERLLHPNWRLALVVGFLGGYTTFSSFEYETLQAFTQGSKWTAALNVVASLVLGYIAVWLGALLASRR